MEHMQGYADVGFNRAKPDKEVVSPNIDQLVAEGVHLTRHYVHQYCTPTRTSVQSGRLPVHVSTGLGSPCDDNTGISQNMTGFAERLKEAGYKTAFAGKCVFMSVLACDRSYGVHAKLRLRLAVRVQVGCWNGDSGPHTPRQGVRHFTELLQPQK
jgi:arylsulfatase A-like enzyme